MKSLSCVSAIPLRGDSAFGSQTFSSGFCGAAGCRRLGPALRSPARPRPGVCSLLSSLSPSRCPIACFLSPFRLPLLFTFRSSYFSLSLCLCALSFLPSLQSSRSHPVQFIPERLNSPSLSVSSSILSVDNLFSSIGEIKAKHRELISPVLATGRGGEVTECHSACP